MAPRARASQKVYVGVGVGPCTPPSHDYDAGFKWKRYFREVAATEILVLCSKAASRSCDTQSSHYSEGFLLTVACQWEVTLMKS